MTRLLRSLVLFAAVAGLTAAASPGVAPAQVKDKDKKDVKDKDKKDAKEVKDDTKTVPKADVIELYTDKDGKWRYRVRDAEGKSVAIGVIGYDKKEDVVKTLEAVKAALAKGKVVELKGEPKKK
jgi:uncharacterized protein YegP (UPF0339 family)